VLTDPVFRRRLLHLRRHGRAPADGTRARPDLVLLSHLHLDHADLRSLRELGEDVPVIAPAGSGDYLRGKGLRDVKELRPGETTERFGLTVTGTRADHEGRRVPLVGHRGETMGFVLAGSQRMYFAGDTDLFDGMREIAGGLDLALLPVWGWGTSLGEGHLNPERAARAAALLEPRFAVPIHWGTFFPYGLARRHGHLLHDPPLEFARHCERLAPDAEVRVLEPGTGFDLPGS
jgi:L-ascorbate metabolism protein UlaG (beta-lactamase superfamily)